MDFQDIMDKVGKAIAGFTKKFDKINDKIFETFNIKVNVGLYLMMIVLVIFVFMVIGSILGFVRDFLFGVK